ncbi:MAG: exodeoxyribonuclease VII large subunit, partial [Alphaproteobacteria bacterium]
LVFAAEPAHARAVAAYDIPLLSAVGHETDTTLIDFVSDRRAPTPTAAAEMATPVLSELQAGVMGFTQRLVRAGGRIVEDRRQRLISAGRGLPRREDLLAVASQRFDLAAGRLSAGLARNVAVHEQAFARVSSPLKPGLLARHLAVEGDRVARVSARLAPAVRRTLASAADRISSLDKLLRSLSPDGPLERGFARIHHADGSLARSAKGLASGEGVELVFADGKRGAVVDGKAAAKGKSAPPNQGSLF